MRSMPAWTAMSMAVTLAAPRASGFSIPDRSGHLFGGPRRHPRRRARRSATCVRAGARSEVAQVTRSIWLLELVRFPEILDELDVGLDVRAEDQHLQAVVVGLEGARDARAHAHGIERLEIDQLVVELHAP